MTEKEAISVLNMIEAHGSLPKQAKKTAIQALEKVQQYESIGTVEEFQKLKNKNTAIKAKFDNDDVWECYICPGCGKVVGEHQKYCWNCGQAFKI